MRLDQAAHEIDVIIGLKIKELRLSRGWKRGYLAPKINVTHQQLSKYENATNRISAGRLCAIAQAFKVPVGYFFEDLDFSNTFPIENDRMTLELLRYFNKINLSIKPVILHLVHTLSKTEH